MNHEQLSTMQTDLAANLSCTGVSTAEIERALASHPEVSEVVVLGLKGLCAFISLKEDVVENEVLRMELLERVREETGATGVLETLHFAPTLPRSRSGKIRRGLLEEIANS